MTRTELYIIIAVLVLILLAHLAVNRWLPIDPRHLTRGI